jgi:hypothetical protein
MRAPLVLAAMLGLLLACGAAAPATLLTPQGQTVEAGRGPPPLGARNLGPIDASHGGGCGLLAQRGTYEGALAGLRNLAAEIGGNYVQIESVIEPHDDSGCTTGGFAIRGVVFFVPQGSPQVAPPPRSPPTPTPAPAPTPTPTPTPAPAPAPAPGLCDPLCSPGFVCTRGVCTPVCNPACEADEICTRRRTCEPVAPAVIVDAGAG